MSKKLALLTVLWVLFTLSVAVAQTFSIEDLGTFGGDESRATAINASGQVAGYSKTRDGRTIAFRYTDGGGMEELRGPTPVDPTSNAYGINDAGYVVGSARAIAFGGLFTCAMLWTDEGPRTIGPCFMTFGVARAINNSGQVVGTTGPLTERLSDGFRYDPDGQGVRLGYNSSAFGINADGQFVGTRNGRAVIYTDEEGVQDLSTAFGTAYAINDNGQVVGESAIADGSRHAFRWTDSVMEDLGTLPQQRNSAATAINADGTVVGYSYMGEAQRAFVYTDDHGIQDLNDLIDEPGWVLQTATGINDAGQIVGHGTHNGAVRAFRLTPKVQTLH